jgi:hypothetical protein
VAAHYNDLGRVKGSIEAAVKRAFKAADADPTTPKDHLARLTLLRLEISVKRYVAAISGAYDHE